MHTLTLHFGTPLTPEETPLLRGALIRLLGTADVRLHNHRADGFRYGYPLVQYKSLDGHAAVVGIDGAADHLSTAFAAGSYDVRIGRRTEPLAVSLAKSETVELRLTPDMQAYRIARYLPLNQENHRHYMAMDSLLERYALIERCLRGNILSMAKTLGVRFDDEVKVSLTDIERTQTYTYKNVPMLGFDLTFLSNVVLPGNIGLGQKTSVGFGTLSKQK